MIIKIVSNEVKQIFGGGQCQCVCGSFIGNILGSCGDPWGFGERFETTEILSTSNLFDMEQNCKTACCSKTGTVAFRHSFSNTGTPPRKLCIEGQHNDLVVTEYFTIMKKNN